MEKRLRLTVDDQVKFQKFLKEQAAKGGSQGGAEPLLKIEDLVIEVDDELMKEGYAPFQRPLNAMSRIADRIGISFQIGGDRDDFVEVINDIYSRLYHRTDLLMPPMHIGTFMFRDIFLPLRVLVVYGEASVTPMQGMNGVPEETIRWIFYKQETAQTLFDQWVDLYDFVYALDDISRLKSVPEQAAEYWQLAKQQLEGASATLLGSIDKYTVIQNSIIAMELLLKGVLFAQGMTDEQVKKHGHNMATLIEEVCNSIPHADHARLKMIIGRTPKLVERRYQLKEYKRTELGQIMLDAQFMAGEILRQFSDRNMRASLVMGEGETRDFSQRYYPPIAA